MAEELEQQVNSSGAHWLYHGEGMELDDRPAADIARLKDAARELIAEWRRRGARP